MKKLLVWIVGVSLLSRSCFPAQTPHRGANLPTTDTKHVKVPQPHTVPAWKDTDQHLYDALELATLLNPSPTPEEQATINLQTFHVAQKAKVNTEVDTTAITQKGLVDANNGLAKIRTDLITFLYYKNQEQTRINVLKEAQQTEAQLKLNKDFDTSFNTAIAKINAVCTHLFDNKIVTYTWKRWNNPYLPIKQTLKDANKQHLAQTLAHLIFTWSCIEDLFKGQTKRTDTIKLDYFNATHSAQDWMKLTKHAKFDEKVSLEQEVLNELKAINQDVQKALEPFKIPSKWIKVGIGGILALGAGWSLKHKQSDIKKPWGDLPHTPPGPEW